jgi:CRISPR type IV-associated protein Csf3
MPLMFDGILGYAWAVKKGYRKTPAELHPENLVFPELPLEKVGEKCYAASAAFLPPEASMYPTKIMRHADWKTAMARFGCPATAYETATGWQQACQEPYWLIATPYVDFYYRGDDQGVIDLLSVIYSIGFIGGKRSAGYGQISRIELFEDVEEQSVWRTDGRPSRPVPVEIAGRREGLVPEWTTYYPPYWAAANSAWCYVPPPEQWLPSCNAADIAEKLELHFNDRIQRLQKSETKSEKENKRRRGGRSA